MTSGEKDFLHRLRNALHTISTSTTLAPPHHAALNVRASVLVLISSDGYVLMTQRSYRLRSHPGQVALPGGKQDEDDGGDDVVTALRETEEEVGLDYRLSSKTSDDDGFHILGRLPTMESINHLCVTPIVAVHTARTFRQLHSQLVLNGDEVEAAFWTPLSYFVTAKPTECYEVEWSNGTFVYRHYDYVVETAGNVMWSPSPRPSQQQRRDETAGSTTTFPITGLTAHIVHALASVVYSDSASLSSSSSTANAIHE